MRPILVGTAVLASFLLMAAGPDGSAPSVLVQMTKVHKGSLAKLVNAYGTVEADNSARNTVTAPLAAVVGKVFVRPGEEVAKDMPLLRLDPNPQTSAAYAQAVSALQNAKDLIVHTQELYDQYLATKQELANAKKTEADARAALNALEKQGAGGPRTVRTPFHAIVTKLSVSAGATVDVGTPLLDLSPPGSLVLRVGVIPDEAAEIEAGDPAKITPIGGSRSFTGKVMLRGSMVESGSGLVPVDISLPPGALLPGQTAQAAITTGQIEGFVVPHEAILVDDSGHPYVVQAVDMKARIVPVRVLAMSGDKDTVDGKLNTAAPLILAGNYQLTEGMSVRLSGPPDKQNP